MSYPLPLMVDLGMRGGAVPSIVVMLVLLPFGLLAGYPEVVFLTISSFLVGFCKLT
jgi:hypothetical protein